MEITISKYNSRYKGRTFTLEDTSSTYRMGDIEIDENGLNAVRVLRVEPYEEVFLSSVELTYVSDYINSEFWIIKDKGIKLL